MYHDFSIFLVDSFEHEDCFDGWYWLLRRGNEAVTGLGGQSMAMAVMIPSLISFQWGAGQFSL